jgi:signal transduction histidine kinase
MTSIRRQLLHELLAVTLGLVGGGLLALYFAARDAACDQFDDALRAKALAISTLTTRTATGLELDFSDRFFRGFDDRKPRDFFELWDDSGRAVARSESMPGEKHLPMRTGSLERPERWNLQLPNGRPGRAVGFSFRPNSERLGNRTANRDVRLVVASDREELDETLWQLLGLSAGCAVLLLGGTMWAIPRVLRRGLRPLDEFGEQAKRIDAESLTNRFASARIPAELQPVAQRLNDLLERLEQSFERERRFSADLAHELRTPLAELRSAAECALKWPATRDASTDRETLAIAEHMEAIVAHLLALTRSEQGRLTTNIARFDLEPLVRSAWQGFAARAQSARIITRFSLAPAPAMGDASLVRSILLNLFENAADYTPAGGEIHIAVETASDGTALRIANTTDDLVAEDVPKLFERLWRKDPARSGGRHVGLGLSLARSYARAMGWTLSATLDEPRMLTLTLVCPIARSAVTPSGA